MVQQHDVIICGSGSAGICAATWLARYGIRCKIIESSSGPLTIGKADGVQCRTVEIFESFNIVEELLRESYHVLEVAFWSSDEASGGIVRTGRTADTEPGLSHQPHVILNQARVNGLLIEEMRRCNAQEIDYGYEVKRVEVDTAAATDPEAYCVTVVGKKDGEEEVFKAKYVLGCDGAHSTVRRSLGFRMIGDSSDSVWGVMDVYPQTNFPDIRKKAAIQSESGSLLIIPREGGSLVRFYIELPHGTSPQSVQLVDLHSAAERIFHPYTLDIAETFWWSAYAIGQRLADHFSKDNRVFLTGDACHTHSPKAGQGMNTSLQDGYNIGWKLAAVLRKQARPELLETYVIERERVAADLIAFDREFARAFSSKVASTPRDTTTPPSTPGSSKSQFKELFIKAGRYTAGLTATYSDSCIMNAGLSTQELASEMHVGMRFPSTQVVRFSDARAMQLVKALPSDGRWRLVVFVGDVHVPATKKRLDNLANYLSLPNGLIHRFTTQGADVDSYIEPILVLAGKRVDIEQGEIPEIFWPATGKWKIRSLHKIFFDDFSYNSGHGHAYEFYGIEPHNGAIVVVRPDQYISMVTRLDDFEGIENFFERFSIPVV